MLFSTHTMLAAMTNVEELALDRDEAKNLAEAAAAVGRHYDMALPEKTIDWYNLMTMAGAVYGPRLWVLMGKRKRGQNTVSAAPVQPAPVRPVVVEPAPPKPGSDVIEIPGLAPFRRSMN